MIIRFLTRVCVAMILALIMTSTVFVSLYAVDLRQAQEVMNIHQRRAEERAAAAARAQRAEDARAIATFVLIVSVVGGIWAIVYYLQKKDNTLSQTTNENINHYHTKTVPKSSPSPSAAYSFCTECGKKNVETDNFCSGCGMKKKADT